MTTIALINILVGAALLLFGRRIFWVFVAGVGFVAGALVATEVFEPGRPWLVFLIALAVGIAGALLSVVLQYVVVAVAGFLAGAYLLHAVAVALGFVDPAWIGFLIGGVIGMVLVLALLNWALIVLSTLVGATVIVQNCSLEAVASALLFVFLSVLGLVVQARQVRPERAVPGTP